MMAPGTPASANAFRKTALAVLLILYATGALIYGHSLLAPFYFDDLEIIVENPGVRLTRLTGAQLADIPRGQPAGRALTMITFGLNYYFHQYRTAGYRLVNILIHLVTAWLVFCLCWQTLRLMGREPFGTSLLAGLLWMTQPTHTQSVTYIVQRMNSLAAMFYLLALICYIQARVRQTRHAPRTGTVLLFAAGGLAGGLGLLSKEIVATLPVIILLYEWYFFQHLDRTWLKQGMKWLCVAGLLIILVVFIYAGAGGTDPVRLFLSFYEQQPFTPAQRLLTQPRVVLYYLSLLGYPHPDRLQLTYDFPLSSSLTAPVVTIFAVSALAALLFMAVFPAAKNRLLSFAIIWFLGNLVIESSVIGLAPAFEHRLYLPAVFPLITATACLRQRIKPGPAAIAILAGIILCQGFWTYRRNLTWQDRVTFWRDGVAKAPRLSSPRNDYGLALAEAGATEAARAQYEIAIALPAGDKAPAHNNLGKLYYQTGDLDRAERQFMEAIRSKPTFAKAFTNLGIIKSEKNKYPEAIGLIKTALILDPRSSTTHNALAKAYYESGQTAAAIRHCREARRLDPENVNAENNLAAILLNTGQADQALPHLARVMNLSPNHLEANINIGITYDRLGNPGMGIFHLYRAVFLAPDHPGARAELGLLLLRQGRVADARTQLGKALALRPDFPRARLGLASVLEELGQKEAAITQYQAIIADHPDHKTAKKRLESLLDRPDNESHE